MAGALDSAALTRRFEAMAERMRRLEAQVAILSERAGVAYAEPSAAVPPDVLELARAGNVLEAIKAYRGATGASLEEARDVVLGL
jgi:ribosomal protein L7/L12